MKKPHALLYLLLFISTISFGQVYKYKAFQGAHIRDMSHVISDSDYKDMDILIVINLDKKKIKTYGQRELEMDIIDFSHPVTDKDGNQILKMKAVNQEGEDVTAIFKLFSDNTGINIASLAVIFKEGDFLIYRLKNND